MFYVFILQYKNVQNNSKILLKCAETSMIPNILYSSVFSIMSVLYCYHFLPFVVSESGTRREHKFICILLLYSKCNDCRIMFTS
jgi:hypothetical protein